MSDKIDEAIQDIAAKHGVVLGKDDPVIILQTMNEKLIEEGRKEQQEMLAQFKEEMESISSQWRVDAKEKAEKILNAALVSSKETMYKLLQETTNESVHKMRIMMSDSLMEARDLTKQTRKYSRLALLSSSVMLVATSCLFVLIYLAYGLQ